MSILILLILLNCQSLDMGKYNGCKEEFKFRMQLKRHLEKCQYTSSSSLKKCVKDYYKEIDNTFICLSCQHPLKHKTNLKRHNDLCKGPKKPFFKCTNCDKTFAYQSKLNEHVITHNRNTYCCEKCGKTYERKFLYETYGNL